MRALVAGFLVLLAGCATTPPAPNVIMVNANGDRQVCAGTETSALATGANMLAYGPWYEEARHEQQIACVRRWRELGYRPDGEVTPKIILETQDAPPQ